MFSRYMLGGCSTARSSASAITRLRSSPVSSLRPFSTRPTSQPAEAFKILFCGSDEFSVASLQAVLDAEDVWQSITVLTPRERQVARRGSKLYFPPLKTFALDRGLTTIDIPPTGLKGEYAFPAPFTAHHPAHLLLTASFGHIIPSRLLEPFGLALNVHPSLLPRYRGAAPIQWAIANGDKSTGLTVQTVGRREDGVDSGAILGAVENLPIAPDATYATLLPELSHVGGRTLVAVLRQLLRGTATPRAQDGSKVVRAPKITTAVARVDWGQPAHTIEARHRGFGHHSPLWTSVPDVVTADAARDPTLQLLAVSIVGDQPDVLATLEEPQRGTAVLDKRGKRVLVSTGEGAWVQVTRVKAAGKKEMPATEWWNGLPKDVRNRGWVLFE